MAHTFRKRLRPNFSLAVQVLHDAALAAGAAVGAMVNRYQARRALAQFDGRMLADIGLTRSDVECAFSEPVWRDPTRRLAVIAVERRTALRAARRLDRLEPEKQTVAECVVAGDVD